jgi:dienelactone hydrolase
VVFVDYLSARGLPNCRGSGAVNAVEIGRDVLAVARYLQGQPYVKPSQITAVGSSLGGGAVLALGQLTAAENSPLRAVIAYYPYCRDLQPWQTKVPALSLMGAQDEVAPPEVCQRVFARLPPGTALRARVYLEARHGFDVSDLPPCARFGSEIVGYNAAADAAAAREVEQFMSRKTD